jgi:hypothetical protein
VGVLAWGDERCGAGAAGSGEGVAAGAAGLLLDGVGAPVLVGALALRLGNKALTAEAARAAGVAVGTVAEAVVVFRLVVAVGEAVAAVVLAVVVMATLALAAGVTVVDTLVSGVLTVAVAVVPTGSCATGAGVGLRVNQKAAAPIAKAAIPISAQGLEDLAFLAEGGNCAGAVSRGMGCRGMGFMPPVSSALRSDLLSAPGSVRGNCVGANCVLAPYSESL